MAGLKWVGTCSDISLIFSDSNVKSLRKVSEVSILLNNLSLNKYIILLPADLFHQFNFVTLSFKIEYLNLGIEIVPADGSVTKPIYLTSGCLH